MPRSVPITVPTIESEPAPFAAMNRMDSPSGSTRAQEHAAAPNSARIPAVADPSCATSVVGCALAPTASPSRARWRSSAGEYEAVMSLLLRGTGVWRSRGRARRDQLGVLATQPDRHGVETHEG